MVATAMAGGIDNNGRGHRQQSTKIVDNNKDNDNDDDNEHDEHVDNNDKGNKHDNKDDNVLGHQANLKGSSKSNGACQVEAKY